MASDERSQSVADREIVVGLAAILGCAEDQIVPQVRILKEQADSAARKARQASRYDDEYPNH